MFSGFGLSSDRYEKLSRPKSSQNSSGREDELSRDEIIAFLDNATEKLISKEFRDEITEKVNEENRPDFLLMESQLELLEATGIERTRGQKQLNEILIKRKNDKELIKKMQDFETLCHETCIAILKQVNYFVSNSSSSRNLRSNTVNFLNYRFKNSRHKYCFYGKLSLWLNAKVNTWSNNYFHGSLSPDF